MTMKDYMEDLKSNESKPDAKNNFALYNDKRKEKIMGTIAGTVAAAILATGVAHLIDRPNTPTPDSSPISDPDVDTDEEVINSGFKYALVADFAATNEDEVKEVANAIVDNTGVSYEEAINIIKFYNRTLQESDLTGTDLEVFQQLLNMGVNLYNDIYTSKAVTDYYSASNILQSDTATDEEKQNIIASLGDEKVVTPSAILGDNNTTENKEKINEYLALIAKEEEKIQNYNEKINAGRSKNKYNKKIATSNAKITEYQNAISDLKSSEDKYNERINNNLENSLKAIRENDMQALSDLSQEFYGIYEDVLNDEKLSIDQSERWKVYIDYFQAICPIYGNYLTKDQTENLKGEHQGFSLEEYVKELTKNWKLDVAEIIEKYGEDGAYGKPITELEEKYNSNDASSANKSSYAKGNDTKTEEKHGEKANGSSGKQETIKGSQSLGTTVEETITLPTPSTKPEDKVVEEGGKEVSGEEVSGENTVVVEETPGEVISEEVVAPEEETTTQQSTSGSNTTQSSNGSSSNSGSSSNETTTSQTEDVYVDADGEEFDSVMTDDEYAAALVKSMY